MSDEQLGLFGSEPVPAPKRRRPYDEKLHPRDYDGKWTEKPGRRQRRRRGPDAESAAARESVTELTQKQSAVYEVLKRFGPYTDEALIYRYKAEADKGDYPHQSESGIRTRRSELRDAGVVEATGETERISTGRMAKVWRAK